MLKIYATAIIVTALMINMANATWTIHPELDCNVYVASWDDALDPESLHFESKTVVIGEDGAFDQVAVQIFGSVNLVSVSFPIEFENLENLVTPITLFIHFQATHMYDADEDIDETHQIHLGSVFTEATHTYRVGKVVWSPGGALPFIYPKHYDSLTTNIEIIAEPGVAYTIGNVEINDTRTYAQINQCDH